MCIIVRPKEQVLGAGGGAGISFKIIQVEFPMQAQVFMYMFIHLNATLLSATNPLHVQIIHGKSSTHTHRLADDVFIHRARVGIVPAGACIHVVEYTG